MRRAPTNVRGDGASLCPVADAMTAPDHRPYLRDGDLRTPEEDREMRILVKYDDVTGDCATCPHRAQSLQAWCKLFDAALFWRGRSDAAGIEYRPLHECDAAARMAQEFDAAPDRAAHATPQPLPQATDDELHGFDAGYATRAEGIRRAYDLGRRHERGER